MPVLAASSAATEALVSQLSDLVTREPVVLRRVRAERGLTYCERLLADPPSRDAMVGLIDLCQDDPRTTVSLLIAFGLKGLEPDLAFDVLRQGLSVGIGEEGLSEMIRSLVRGGEHRERVIAVHEGREIPEPAEKVVPDIPIVTELSYAPHFHPEFTPVKVMLKRQGKDCPVIIERVTLDQALQILPKAGQEELEGQTLLFDMADPGLGIYLLRTLDGVIEGLSITRLSRDEQMGHVSLQWDLVVKFDRNRETRIEDVGITFFIAHLRELQNQGPWPEMGDVIYHMNPRLLARLRSYLPEDAPAGETTPFRGICRDEAELFLSSVHLSLEEVTL